MNKHGFDPEDVPLLILRERAYNLKWATLPKHVIPLTSADPDYAVALPIQQALITYTRAGVFSYGPPEGLPEFRKVCAITYSQRQYLDIVSDQILAVDSAAAGMRHIVNFALKPGDEAIIFDPVDFLFKAAIESVGGTVKLIPKNNLTGRLDLSQLEKLISKNTKLLCICNPINPTGQILNKDELLTLGEFAVANNLWILNDEIWSDIIYPPHCFTSINSLGKDIFSKTITVNGFSKNFGLAGLRIGYIIAPNNDIYEGIMAASLARTTMSGVATLSQVAAIAAYTEGWSWFNAFLRHLYNQRNYAVKRLSSMPGIKLTHPEATYLLFPNIQELGMSAELLTKKILKKGKVALVPGTARWFGPGAEGHLRIAFATSRKILEEALNRIESVLNT